MTFFMDVNPDRATSRSVLRRMFGGQAGAGSAVSRRGEPVIAEEKAFESVDAPSDSVAASDAGNGVELTEQGGLPRLVSVATLPTFKRILSGTGRDATLQIRGDTKKLFVAVDLSAGTAIVVATPRFRETAIYSTYLTDLQRNSVTVREEMVSTEEVIAQVYESVTRTTTIVSEDSRAIGLFRDVAEAAHTYDATDIHWEYRDFNSGVELRFRVNGDLYTYRDMPKDVVLRALSAAFGDLVQRNTNSTEAFQPAAPSSAIIPIVVQSDSINLRWQSIPSVGGFDVLLRLNDGNFKNVRVKMPHEMGLEASQIAMIEELGGVSGGMTIFTGETGSAKSTLLRAMSYILPDRDLKKQYAVNEPSEMPQPWLTDISIQRRPDETEQEATRKCAEVIRSLMRGDVDDVTVGEVRDSVIMGLVAELALTGHPVRLTLHANSVIAAYMRLAGARIQLPLDEIAAEGIINAVGNQRLIPLLCQNCKRPAREVMPNDKLELLRGKFGLDASNMYCRNEEGCEQCRLKGLFTRDKKTAGGTKGLTLAMELMRPTPEFLDRIAERDWRGAEQVWRTSRTTAFDDPDMTGKTIYEHALYKASQGVIDPRFIDRSMNSFSHYRVFADRDGRMPT